MGGATRAKQYGFLLNCDFNPRSPWGERQNGLRQYRHRKNFNPRSPWGSDVCFPRCDQSIVISIHAPRGGSDQFRLAYVTQCFLFQSTLPVGGATTVGWPIDGDATISIHAPRGGSDIVFLLPSLVKNIFQSTLPVGGATVKDLIKSAWTSYFNPRSPWGERLSQVPVILTAP